MGRAHGWSKRGIAEDHADAASMSVQVALSFYEGLTNRAERMAMALREDYARGVR